MKNALLAILIGLAAAAIVYFAGGKLSKDKLNKKYDGQVVLEADLYPGSMDLLAIKHTLTGRLERKKITHDIKIPGQNRLEVIAKGISDTGAFIRSLVFNGKLEILEVYPAEHPVFSSFTMHFDELASALEPDPVIPTPVKEKKEALTDEVNALIDSISDETQTDNQKSHFARYINMNYPMPPAIGSVKISDTMKVMRLLNDPRFREHIPVDMIFRWGPDNYNPQRKKEDRLRLYILKAVPVDGRHWISNEDIADANAETDGQGRPVVTFRLTSEGAHKWEWLTGKNTGRHLAIIVSDIVQSAPMVESVISGGNAQISGNFSLDETKLLATLISSPALPVKLHVPSATFLAKSPSRGARQLLWPLIVFLVLGVTAYFILNSLTIKPKNSFLSKK